MNLQTFKELSILAHDNAKEDGLWTEKRNIGEALMLIIKNLSDAVEADKKGRYADLDSFYFYKGSHTNLSVEFDIAFLNFLEGTFEIALADAIISLMDVIQGFFSYGLYDFWYCISVEDINPKNAGMYLYNDEKGNYNKSQLILGLCEIITIIHCQIDEDEPWEAGEGIKSFMQSILWFCENYKIDIEKFIRLKIIYNSTKPKMHGKKY